MRLEKGYRVWGADITPDETPYEGGVGFCVKLDKEGGFIGREALVDGEGSRPADAALLPDPRRPALGRARQRAGPDRRRDRRPGDDRRLRLHGRALDRLRLPAARARRAGDRGRGRDLRPTGSTARSRPSRSSTPRASASAPDLRNPAPISPRSAVAARSTRRALPRAGFVPGPRLRGRGRPSRRSPARARCRPRYGRRRRG